MSRDDTTDNCNSPSESYKCSIFGCDHSSLDRRCKTFRTVKREAANHAVELITNSKLTQKKKTKPVTQTTKINHRHVPTQMQLETTAKTSPPQTKRNF